MAGKRGGWAALVLLVAFLAAAPAEAGPFLGEWGWCWNPAPGCPCSMYPRLHYWAPGVYKVRAWVHPSNLDQYPPGLPIPPAPIGIAPSACRTQPPTPNAPYAAPDQYFGRSTGKAIAPP